MAAGEADARARKERFLALTGPHMEGVLRVALRLTRTPDAAEDAVQETYLRAWRHFDRFDETREMRVWLLAILRNLVFDEARRHKRRPRPASVDEIGADNIVGRPAPPSESLTDEAVLAALDRLPEEFGAVVLLVVVEGLTYREAAAALDIPVGTVMSRLFRARRLLQHHLRGYAEEEGLATAG